MAYPDGPRDGKSNIGRPFLPEPQGQAKSAFDRAGEAQLDQASNVAGRASEGQGKVPESIKQNAPGPALNMEGGRGIQQHYAAQRLSKEAAAEKLKQDAAKVAAKSWKILPKTGIMRSRPIKPKTRGTSEDVWI